MDGEGGVERSDITLIQLYYSFIYVLELKNTVTNLSKSLTFGMRCESDASKIINRLAKQSFPHVHVYEM